MKTRPSRPTLDSAILQKIKDHQMTGLKPSILMQNLDNSTIKMSTLPPFQGELHIAEAF